MVSWRYLVISLLLALMVIAAGCGRQTPSTAPVVTLEQLLSSPQQYNGKTVVVETFCFSGFETIVLSERLELSGYAAGHLVPKGRMLWIEGGIPREVYDRLYQQQMMGPTERYGKVRVKGKFEYGGQYGHLGGFNARITPAEMELLAWSPPQG